MKITSVYVIFVTAKIKGIIGIDIIFSTVFSNKNEL